MYILAVVIDCGTSCISGLRILVGYMGVQVRESAAPCLLPIEWKIVGRIVSNDINMFYTQQHHDFSCSVLVQDLVE
jgi:hypothetical protein